MGILLKFLIRDPRGEKIDRVRAGLTQRGVGAWRQGRGGAEGRRGCYCGNAGFGTDGSVHVYVAAGTLEGTRCGRHPRAHHFTWDGKVSNSETAKTLQKELTRNMIYKFVSMCYIQFKSVSVKGLDTPTQYFLLILLSLSTSLHTLGILSTNCFKRVPIYAFFPCKVFKVIINIISESQLLTGNICACKQVISCWKTVLLYTYFL